MSLLFAIRKAILDGVVRTLSTRRLRSLTFRLMQETGVQSVVVERGGRTWSFCVQPEAIFWSLFVDGGYQTAEMMALVEWLRRSHLLEGPRNLLVEAGANIGTTCIPFVLETGWRALAIEPASENFVHLRNNVESNGLSNRIHLTQKAVTQTHGRLRMVLRRGYPGTNFLERSGQTGVSQQMIAGYEDVETAPLTGIIQDAGLNVEEVGLVWADVQGCELDVIESGEALWERGVPLWAEVEPHSLKLQASYDAFAPAAARHFDRFIPSSELLRLRADTQPLAISEFPHFLQAITPEQRYTDVLFLPPSFRARH